MVSEIDKVKKVTDREAWHYWLGRKDALKEVKSFYEDECDTLPFKIWLNAEIKRLEKGDTEPTVIRLEKD